VRRPLFFASQRRAGFFKIAPWNSIHKFAEAIAFNSTASLLLAYIGAGGQSTAGRRLSEANIAVGDSALINNATGSNNTAIGSAALQNNDNGSENIALGEGAGENLTTGDNNIDIGNSGVSGESNTIRIGTQGTQVATYIAGISGAPLDSGVAVVVDATTGQLGVLPSSLRFKKDVKAMDAASEAILALRPVSFCYKGSKGGNPQFGLIAEEVAEVDPDLVVRDKNGEIYTGRCDAVNAMLLNEFGKEHRKVEQLEKRIEALTAGLQKVSAHLATTSPPCGGLETSRPAKQVALTGR
jgi:hypothetical protein